MALRTTEQGSRRSRRSRCRLSGRAGRTGRAGPEGGGRKGDDWWRSFRLRVRVGEIRSRRSGGMYAAAVEIMAEFGVPFVETDAARHRAALPECARFLQGERKRGELGKCGSSATEAT